MTSTLSPVYTNQKSFNNKAIVKEYTDKNGVQVKELTSYTTVVCVIENNKDFYRTWGGYSATTMKHIHEFRLQNGLSPMGKKEWEQLPVTRNKY